MERSLPLISLPFVHRPAATRSSCVVLGHTARRSNTSASVRLTRLAWCLDVAHLSVPRSSQAQEAKGHVTGTEIRTSPWSPNSTSSCIHSSLQDRSLTALNNHSPVRSRYKTPLSRLALALLATRFASQENRRHPFLMRLVLHCIHHCIRPSASTELCELAFTGHNHEHQVKSW